MLFVFFSASCVGEFPCGYGQVGTMCQCLVNQLVDHLTCYQLDANSMHLGPLAITTTASACSCQIHFLAFVLDDMRDLTISCTHRNRIYICQTWQTKVFWQNCAKMSDTLCEVSHYRTLLRSVSEGRSWSPFREFVRTIRPERSTQAM